MGNKKEIIFIATDIPKQIDKATNEVFEALTHGMSKTEVNAFQCGVETAKSIVQSIIDSLDDDEILIHKTINDKFDEIEYDYKDLCENALKNNE